MFHKLTAAAALGVDLAADGGGLVTALGAAAAFGALDFPFMFTSSAFSQHSLIYKQHT